MNSSCCFFNLVDKKVSDIKFALFQNDADLYEDSKKEFIHKTKKELEKLTMQIEITDLQNYIESGQKL